ncbi:MAG: GerMN domain-containing protein [Candidatus Paceibacterota bacterium]
MNKLTIALILVLIAVGLYFGYTMTKTSDQAQVPEDQEPTTQMVEVYFGHSDKGGQDCSAVFAVEREIEKTEGTGKAALKELLEGPTDQEKENGYFTSIGEGVELNSLNIEDGVATADFSEELNQGGGSCTMEGRRAEIIETLKQFPTVDEVVISVEGETEGVLQP